MVRRIFMFYPYFYFDPTYVLVLIGVIICMVASAKMNSTFSKYSRVRSRSGLTGREAAEMVLQSMGIYDVRVERVSGNLTDHYDPRSKVLRLSDSTYNSPSVAAIGVAAHECGHAMQHARGYAPLSLRSALVPIANFGSTIAWPLILLGFLFTGETSAMFLKIGVLAFSLAVLFQLVTLPVEFNASRRAMQVLGSNGMLYQDELSATKKVLTAAALTYVASAASAILQLLRIILLTGRRRND
jgi:Zn-dependent membrane protease YugP